MNFKPVVPKSPETAKLLLRFAHPYDWTVTWEMLRPSGWHREGHRTKDHGVLRDMRHPPCEHDRHEVNLGEGKTRAEASASRY